MATITFRGVTIADESTNLSGYDLVFPLLQRESIVQAPEQGDGEFVREGGCAGGDGSLSITFRVADNGLATLYAALEALQGPPRGTLVTPEGTVERVTVLGVSAPNPQRVILQSGSAGWLVAVTLTLRRSK